MSITKRLKMSNIKAIKNNIIFGLGSKILTIILGFLIPRLIIISFGSEINGLLSTITQIYMYLALLEAGIGNATTNALYKPLDIKDYVTSIDILSAAHKYYRQVTHIYFFVVVLFSFIYPWCVNSAINRSTIMLVALTQGLTSCISYYFCAIYNQLLDADAHKYVTENINLFGYILSSIAKIWLIYSGFNVIVVQIANLILVIIKIFITYKYCKKEYSWLKYRKNVNKKLLQQRGAFIVHEISSVVFSNTDVFIISSFCGFMYASVYSVYQIIYSAMNSLINTANGGLGFILGQNYYKDKKKFLFIFEIYDIIYTISVYVIFSVLYIITTPFISLYTKDVSDINYIIPHIPLLFAIINIMSGSRAVSARLITVTGNVKNTQNRSIIEAIINIIASLICVKIWGFHGVLIGTIIALLYRMNDIIIFVNKYILNRQMIKAYKNIIINNVIFLIVIIIFKNVSLVINNYIQLILNGLLISLIISVTYLLINILFNIELIKEFIIELNLKRNKQFVEI